MPGTIKEQIDAMLDAGGPTEPPSTELPSTTPPGTDAPGTDLPGTDAPSTSAPTTTAPTTAAPEESELSKALSEIESLRQEVSDLTKKEPKTAAPTTSPPVEELDFLGEDIDPRDMTNEELNKILNKVYKAGSEAMRKSQEDTLRSIPKIVKTNVVTQATLKSATEKFFNDNKDLLPFRKAVATVYEELASENPDWKLDKILEETEREARKRLELHKRTDVTSAPTTSAPASPKFPKTGTSRQRQKPKTSKLLDEIDAMNKL